VTRLHRMMRPVSEPLLQALGVAWKQDPEKAVRDAAFATIQRLDERYPGLLQRMKETYASL
jgi:hypothetical protein